MQPFKPLKKVDHRPWWTVRAAWTLDGRTWKPLSVREPAARVDETEWFRQRKEREENEKRDREMRKNPIPVTFTVEGPNTTTAIVKV